MKNFKVRNETPTFITKTWKPLLYSFVALFIIAGLVNCGGKQSASQPPKALIEKFIVEKDTMINPSLSDFYVKAEQSGVADLVNKSIEGKESADTIEAIRNATYDFSGLKVNVSEQKESYVDYQLYDFIKVEVTGNYIMKMQQSTKTIPTDKTIIFELVDNNWKVTEKINPWG